MKKLSLNLLFLFYMILPSFGESEPEFSLDETLNGPFDFYVLALSWSPSFCEQNKDNKSLQCKINTPRDYAFVVHGLWPQFRRGWPEFCQKNARNPRKKIINSMLDIMPSRGLIKHQWKKHGTCAQLTQKQYFAKTRAAYNKIKIPKKLQNLKNYVTTSPTKIKQAFIGANHGLDRSMMLVTCSRNFLREVRICMDKALNFIVCPDVKKGACKRSKITLPPVR